MIALLGCSAGRPAAPTGPEASVAARSSAEAAVPEQMLPVHDPKQLTQGTPADYVVYDRGLEADSKVYDLHVDASRVYWSQRTARLFEGAVRKCAPRGDRAMAPATRGHRGRER